MQTLNDDSGEILENFADVNGDAPDPRDAGGTPTVETMLRDASVWEPTWEMPHALVRDALENPRRVRQRAAGELRVGFLRRTVAPLLLSVVGCATLAAMAAFTDGGGGTTMTISGGGAGGGPFADGGAMVIAVSLPVRSTLSSEPWRVTQTDVRPVILQTARVPNDVAIPVLRAAVLRIATAVPRRSTGGTRDEVAGFPRTVFGRSHNRLPRLLRRGVGRLVLANRTRIAAHPPSMPHVQTPMQAVETRAPIVRAPIWEFETVERIEVGFVTTGFVETRGVDGTTARVPVRMRVPLGQSATVKTGDGGVSAPTLWYGGRSLWLAALSPAAQNDVGED